MSLVSRPDRTRDDIGSDIAASLADLGSFGPFSMANPDLADRLRSRAPFNSAHRPSIFGGGAQGCTDYPTINGNVGAS